MHRRLQTALVEVAGGELVDPDLGAQRRRGYGEGPLGRLVGLDRGDAGRSPSVLQISWKATPSSGSDLLTGTGPSERTTETPSGCGR